MRDYIKREDARKAACELCDWHGLCGDGCKKPIPAANVVEVVRCEDCKYWEQSKIEPSFRVCTYVCGATFVREADDFCSRAEKRRKADV